MGKPMWGIDEKLDAIVATLDVEARNQLKEVVKEIGDDIRNKAIMATSLAITLVLLGVASLGYTAMKDFMSLQGQVIATRGAIIDAEERLAAATRRVEAEQQAISRIRGELESAAIPAPGAVSAPTSPMR